MVVFMFQKDHSGCCVYIIQKAGAEDGNQLRSYCCGQNKRWYGLDCGGHDKNGQNKAVFQSRVKEHTDGLDMEMWYMRIRGIKKGSLLEDFSGWYIILLRWRKMGALCTA